MVKPSQPKQAPRQQAKGEARETYKDRNLMGANPLKAQEELKPTDAEPVSLHKRMAGC